MGTVAAVQEPSAAEVSIIAGMGVADVRTPPKEWQNYIFPGEWSVPHILREFRLA